MPEPNAADFKTVLTVFNLAAKEIEGKYFLVVQKTRRTKEYFERVYCYELYHQVRLLIDAGESWPDRYALWGEHPKTNDQTSDGPITPDFLIYNRYEPGYNLAVIEVKHVNAATDRGKSGSVLDTTDNLASMLSGGRLNYFKGILWVYGNKDGFDDADTKTTIQSINEAFGAPRLIYIRHTLAGSCPTEIAL